LHSIKISHRDLKPYNILIKGNKIKGNTIKIADLGLGYLQDKSGVNVIIDLANPLFSSTWNSWVYCTRSIRES